MKEKIKDLFKTTSKYDSKHITNLSTKKVPDSLVRQVEKGCSLETLETLAKGYPICKYQTQITIHGIFGELNTRCVGDYVNLTRNKNRSLGVRWTAIDHEKKDKLFHDIEAVCDDWYLHEDSQSFSIRQSKRVGNEKEYQEVYDAFKQKANIIDTSLFIGVVKVYGFVDVFGLVYVVLDVNIQCFPIDNHAKIVENITGKTMYEVKKACQAIEAAKKAEEAAWKKQREEEERKRKREEEERTNRIKEWMRNNPIPKEFVLVDEHEFQPGDIVCAHVDPTPEGFTYRYEVYYKAFGRLCVARSDINGKRLGSGTEVWKRTRKKVYLKK